jgi:oligopeptide transport system substrate-binding protein
MKFFANALFHRKRAFCFFHAPQRRRQETLILLLCLALLALVGCSGGKPKADLAILNGPDPQSLDPHVVTGQADMRVVLSLFEGLTRFDPVTANPNPAIAEHWDISSDQKTYTFHLRTNAVWSTGQPITADDFVFSWTRALDPKVACDYANQLFYIRNGEAFNTGIITDAKRLGVKAIGPHTLEVQLNSPTPFFLELCAIHAFAAVPKFFIERYGDGWLRRPNFPCSGAYALDFQRVADRIRIRKNANYWDAANVSLNTIDFITCTAPTTALNLYKTGYADIIWDKLLVPNELMDVLTQGADWHPFDFLATEFVRFNVTRGPFTNVLVRKAFALAVDRKRLLERIARGGERATSHLTPDGIPHYRPPDGLGYDPKLARELLAQAGFPGGRNFPTVQYLFNTTPINERFAVELQAMWRNELGVNVELRQTEWKVYLDLQSKVDYEISRSSWVGDYKDPNTFLELFTSNNGNNRTGWTNRHYDTLIASANREADLTAREKIFQQAESLLVRDEMPILPIYIYRGHMFFDPAKWEGLYGNLVDEHLVSAIRRKGQSMNVEMHAKSAPGFRRSHSD